VKLIKATDLVKGDRVIAYDGYHITDNSYPYSYPYRYVGVCIIEDQYTSLLRYSDIVVYSRGMGGRGYKINTNSTSSHPICEADYYYKLTDHEYCMMVMCETV